MKKTLKSRVSANEHLVIRHMECTTKGIRKFSECILATELFHTQLQCCAPMSSIIRMFRLDSQFSLILSHSLPYELIAVWCFVYAHRTVACILIFRLASVNGKIKYNLLVEFCPRCNHKRDTY